MFSESTLNLLPTPALGSLSNGLTAKGLDKSSELAAQKARSEKQEGLVETDDTFLGRTVTTLKNTLDSIDSAVAVASAAKSVYDLAQTLTDGGEEAYNPESLPEGTTGSPAEIGVMGAELSDSLENGAANEDMSVSMNLQATQTKNAITKLEGELNEILESIDQVNTVLAKRADGTLPDPELNVAKVSDALENIVDNLGTLGFDTAQQDLLREELERSANVDMDNYDKYITDNIVTPYQENTAALDIITAQMLGEETDTSTSAIFDTVFGPPISTEGKFILSEDGIYYDSRGGSIPYITAEKINSRSWELRYASNRGGKGELYGDGQHARFADTILSYDYKNETGSVKDFYKYDDILQNLENDRDLQIQDVSGKIYDLINTHGYDTTAAIIKNYEDSYAAIGFSYEAKIKKRKKQLQIAALFGPFGVTKANDPQGEGLFYRTTAKDHRNIIPRDDCGSESKVNYLTYMGSDDLTTSAFEGPIVESSREFIPRIPINDFSYLKEVGLVPELVAQESQMLHSSDLDDTTAPIAPRFLTQGPGEAIQAIPEMSIAPEGLTDWINTSGDTSVSGTVPYLRTLDSEITTDELVVCYNFLEPSAVVAPSSNEFGVRNYVPEGYPLNAKMVGSSASAIFVSGVTIPYLKGGLYNIAGKYGSRYAHLSGDTGQYVRLPNNFRNNKLYSGSQKLDSLMYNAAGWTFDFWAYTPDLSSGLTTSHRYKLVAANENCGTAINSQIVSTRSVTAQTNTNTLQQNRTKGIMIGWRDKGNPGSSPSGLEFGVWPTVAQNDERWGKSVCIAETVSGDGATTSCRTELGFNVGFAVSSLSGYTIGDASGAFTHYALTCDHVKDAITLYVNGQFIASSLVSTAFGSEPGVPLNLPTQLTEGCYQDNSGRFGEHLFTGSLISKPPIFTPWILGGGFTDGIGHERPPIFSSTFPGFLGTNTNTSYFSTTPDSGGGPFGQHSESFATTSPPQYSQPGLGGYTPSVNCEVARSGLDGHLGSFKMYAKPLSTLEVTKNYNAQRPFFTGIETPFRLL